MQDIGSFERQRKILDKAINSDGGLRLEFLTEKAAKSFRSSCYGFRKLDRNQTRESLEPGAECASIYDSLTFELDIAPWTTPRGATKYFIVIVKHKTPEIALGIVGMEVLGSQPEPTAYKEEEKVEVVEFADEVEVEVELFDD